MPRLPSTWHWPSSPDRGRRPLRTRWPPPRAERRTGQCRAFCERRLTRTASRNGLAETPTSRGSHVQAPWRSRGTMMADNITFVTRSRPSYNCWRWSAAYSTMISLSFFHSGAHNDDQQCWSRRSPMRMLSVESRKDSRRIFADSLLTRRGPLSTLQQSRAHNDNVCGSAAFDLSGNWSYVV